MEIIPLANDHRDLVGFAVDTPQPDVSYPGDGIEITGWVIGRSEPAASVLATVNEGATIEARLDVRRPDVLADYPDYSLAGQSGFSVWVPIPPSNKDWSIALEAVLTEGARIPLARLIGGQADKDVFPGTGLRPVSTPDYIILGTQRGGTTSLFRYLGAHPDVCNPATKELHFLTDHFHRGVSWYRGQFPEVLQLGELTGEATPYALFHPRAPARAKLATPTARFIVLLRDPVERALSHYRHERGLGIESLSFADAITVEATRLAGEVRRLKSDSRYASFNHKHFSYLERGNYFEQLARWLSYFPRDQFLILRSEDLYADPGATTQHVFGFLGLRAIDVGPFEAHNQSAEASADDALISDLRRHFAPINDRLSQFVDWPALWS